MSRFWILLVCIVAACALATAQVNFTPGWGKRAGAGAGSVDAACKAAPVDSLMYIYKLIQVEAQKIVDCERLSNM